MNDQRTKLRPGTTVLLVDLPAGFADDLPEGDQRAIRGMIGKPILLSGYDENGRAELEFREADGTIHFIYVEPSFIKALS
jgi:hypothetical protein